MIRRWLSDYVVAIVVLMVVAIPLLRWEPQHLGSSAYRNVAVQALGVLLLCAVLTRLDLGPGIGARLGRFLFSGVNGLVLAFFAWAALSAFWIAPGGVGRAFAINDLLRLGAGVLVYLVVANHVVNRRQLETLIDAVLLIVAVATLYRIFTPQLLIGAPSPIGSRLLAGAFLCLVLPIVAAAAAAPSTPRRQIAARVVTVLTLVTLLVTPTRSSWLAALVGMAVFGLLYTRFVSGGVRGLAWQRHRVVFPVVALGGAMVMLQVMSDISTRASARAGTLSQAARGADTSFQERVKQWQGTLRAVAGRPLLGLGLGNYVIRQQRFTGIGRSPADVARRGASMQEQAHSEYLQTAAELGLPGLLLYLLILLAFFAKSINALRELPSGTRKLLLLGCIGAVAAQSVDALTNPAWRYSVCALYFWLVLGTGVALVRMAYRPSQRPVARPVPAERAMAA